MRRLAGAVPTRPSRRTRRARRRGAAPPAGRLDLRGTMRASMRTAGDPFERHWREPGERPRPLVLVCDVSGSMEPYARMLLAYMQACVAARRRVEAFVFGTRLTRVTAELRGRDPDAALERAAGAARDWSGGTRIGEALATLNREHGAPARPRRGRGAAVRRLGPRRARAARARGRAAGPLLAPADLAQPAQGAPRLRAADPRDAGRAAARRRVHGGQLACLARGAGGRLGSAVDGKAAQRGERVIGGLVLAAGAGTRFGRPKQLVELDGRPLLEHAIQAMTAAPVGRVVVVLGAGADQVIARGRSAGRRLPRLRALGRGPVGLARVRARARCRTARRW